MNTLPAESPLGGARSNPTPAPATIPSPVPTNALNNMRINNEPPPPAYHAPALPSRSPAPPPQKVELARATALYAYSEPNDCSFNAGDQIAVYEYMNADWWLGKNLRTGVEGVFPVTYVQVQPQGPPANVYGNEKQNYGGYPGQQMQPPQASNPYNNFVPPMAVAEQPADGKPSKSGVSFLFSRCVLPLLT